jgi:O-acetyl-ADP-ribose deacetylase (regulator of RNase III)
MSLGGRTNEAHLRSSMTDSFRLAREHAIRTIAIPAVGSGIAGFPIDDCARVMAAALRDAEAEGWHPDEVRFVLIDDQSSRVFERSFWAAWGPPPHAEG